MNPREPAYRFHTKKALAAIIEKFNWPYEDLMQDWPLEISDKIDLADCLREYPNLGGEDEKFLLMRGILYALDEFEGENLGLFKEKTAQFLKADFDIHKSTIYYWSGFGKTAENGFAITQFMREVWNAQR